LHLLTLRFNGFTSFLKVFSFGDHHGTYFDFGRNGGNLALFISSSSFQIVVIVVPSCSFVADLLTRSSHFCLCCITFCCNKLQLPTLVAIFLVGWVAARLEGVALLLVAMLNNIRLWSDSVFSSLILQS